MPNQILPKISKNTKSVNPGAEHSATIGPNRPKIQSESRELIALARASTARQSESCSTQFERIARHAELKRYVIVESLEAQESGKIRNRSSVEYALDAVRAGRASGIIVTRLDRLARNLAELLRITSELHAAGGVLVCTEQSIDTSTAEGRLFFHIMGSLAEFERELITIRVNEGVQHAKEKGTHCGRAPYGFRAVNGSLEPVESEQAVIRQARELRDSGLTWEQTAAELSQQTGKSWYPTQVRRILK